MCNNKINEHVFRSPNWLQKWFDFELRTGDDIIGSPSKYKVEKEKLKKWISECSKFTESQWEEFFLEKKGKSVSSVEKEISNYTHNYDIIKEITEYFKEKDRIKRENEYLLKIIYDCGLWLSVKYKELGYLDSSLIDVTNDVVTIKCGNYTFCESDVVFSEASGRRINVTTKIKGVSGTYTISNNNSVIQTYNKIVELYNNHFINKGSNKSKNKDKSKSEPKPKDNIERRYLLLKKTLDGYIQTYNDMKKRGDDVTNINNEIKNIKDRIKEFKDKYNYKEMRLHRFKDFINENKVLDTIIDIKLQELKDFIHGTDFKLDCVIDDDILKLDLSCGDEVYPSKFLDLKTLICKTESDTQEFSSIDDFFSYVYQIIQNDICIYESLNESVVKFSPSFVNVLRKMDNDLSKRVLSINNKDIDTMVNYIDIFDSNSLSFIPDKKAQEIISKNVDVKYKYIRTGAFLNNTPGNQYMFDIMGVEPSTDEPSVEDTLTLIKTEKSNKSETLWSLVEDQDGKKYVINNNSIILNDSSDDSKLWAMSKSNNMRVGRLIRGLLKSDKNDVKDSDIEKFVNQYKSTLDILNDKFLNFSIVSGEDIALWYHEDKYAQGEKGTLGGSCMRYDKCSEYLQIYVENPDVISLLIYVDNNDKLLGRALIWTSKDGDKFMDRVYTHNDSDNILFKQYAKEKGLSYKKLDNMWATGDLIKPDGTEVSMDLSYDIKNMTYDYYPYMDTMKYYSEGKISNTRFDGCYTLEDTEGSYSESSCEFCNGNERVECPECDGSGEVREECYECEGSGKVECSECDGSGEEDCELCSGSGEIEEGEETIECTDCGGSGKNECSVCNGDGKMECGNCGGSGEVEQECGNCNGDGNVDCPECQ